MSDSWLIELKPTTTPQNSRLICFPFAGGGTSNYVRWRESLRPDIGLYAFNLPGRERYFNKPFPTDYAALINTMVEQILPLADKPLIFFGHSFGGLSAYFTALKLQAHNITPQQIIVSARLPPNAAPRDAIAHLSNVEFLHHLITDYNGIPEVIRTNKELLDLFLPIIKKDFLIYEQFPNVYTALSDAQLACNLTCISYSDDKYAHEEFNLWRDLTQNTYQHLILPGGHFEILVDFKKVIEWINQL